MANQIVNVLASIIETINNHEDASLDRAKQIAQAIMQLQSSVDELAERISKLEVKPAAIDTDISSDDAAKLLGMMKGKSTEATEENEEESEDADMKAQLKAALESNEKTRKSAAKPKPQPEPEEEDEEIDEEDEEEALDNVANPDETKSIFQSKSTGRQRIICMNYLKQAGRKSECRMPDKLTWDYCSTIKADESSSKSAIQQWLEFVVAYEQSNG
jgi:hypothetical protein